MWIVGGVGLCSGSCIVMLITASAECKSIIKLSSMS